MELPIIPIDRVKPKPGNMTARLFANLNIGLEPSLFYDIEIPLEPFDTGLDYEENPFETSFSLEFIKFPVNDWRKFGGQSFELSEGDSDSSIYLGTEHNPAEIKYIKFTDSRDNWFTIECLIFCNFEAGLIGQNNTFKLQTEVEFRGLSMDIDLVRPNSLKNLEDIRNYVEKFVPREAYDFESQTLQFFRWFPARIKADKPA